MPAANLRGADPAARRADPRAAKSPRCRRICAPQTVIGAAGYPRRPLPGRQPPRGPVPLRRGPQVRQPGLPPPRRRHLRPPPAVGARRPRDTSSGGPAPRHQRRQARHAVQRLDDHVGGAVPVGRLQGVAHLTLSGERQPARGDRRRAGSSRRRWPGRAGSVAAGAWPAGSAA